MSGRRTGTRSTARRVVAVSLAVFTSPVLAARAVDAAADAEPARVEQVAPASPEAESAPAGLLRSAGGFAAGLHPTPAALEGSGDEEQTARLAAQAARGASAIDPGRARPGDARSAASDAAAEAAFADDRRRRTAWFLGAGAAGVLAFGMGTWWREGLTTDFSVEHEGWFGQSTKKGGTDKLGHAFSTYVGVRAGAGALRAFGHSQDDAVRLATLTSIGVLGAVELIDGFSKRYRFSPEDMIMNVSGAALGWLMERYPALDEAIDVRLLYLPSHEARKQHKFNPVDDYSGQKYLVVAKAAGLPVLRDVPALRYVEFAVGYGSRGYDPDPGPGATRTRRLYLGISLNLSRLLDDTVFRDDPSSAWRQGTHALLELFQVPGTALLAGRRID